MQVILAEEEAEAAAEDGPATTAEIADETATSISETDAMDRTETREAASETATGTGEIGKATEEDRARQAEAARRLREISATETLRLASMPRDPDEAQETAARLRQVHPTPILHSCPGAASEAAEIEAAEGGVTEAGDEEASTTTVSATASVPAAALRKGVGVATETSATVATDGLIPTLAETPATTVILVTASC